MDPAAPARPPRKRTIMPVIAAVVVWLAVGAMLTAALAGSVFAVSLPREPYEWSQRTTSKESVPWPVTVSPEWPAQADGHGTGRSFIADHAVHFASRPFIPFSPQLQYEIVVHTVGWPLRCLQFQREIAWPSNYPPRDAVRPLWPGFALNTLFYAAIAWLLWRIPILIHRHRRRIRGLCVKCAYNRAGLAPGAPCPECGQPPIAAGAVVSDT